ncbi:hypothetical protein B0H14DRAFT_3526628 [Mycena olivaceomarginata]|nr:hypothetical protein B0H14DRAFT_3526628 [Mycena olivaceomarginata]
MLAVIANPTLFPSALFPSNPCLLVICPTIPLQLELFQSTNMTLLGLDVLAINSQTRSDALRLKNYGSSAEFEKVLRDKEFYARSCIMGFDKFHLLNTWGASFQKDFQQTGFVKLA